MAKLSALRVKSAGPGKHVDGKGLMLVVKPSGAKSWVLRVQHQGKREDVGLGSLDDLTLAEARERAASLRKVARQGMNARAERDRGKQIMPTFAEAIDLAHAELAQGWAEKTGDAFKRSLEEHAVPTLGKHRVSAIGAEHVIAALAPIWTEKPQQARKVRVRIMQVLGFARSSGWRTSPLPDPGDIRRGLAKQPRLGNFAAMPIEDVPAFVEKLSAGADTPARLALLFTIFTAARSGEVRSAKWAEIDTTARTWTRPAEVMKSRVAHVVTLNQAALDVLNRAALLSAGKPLVFPSIRRGEALSDAALSKMLRDSSRAETVHGFRSTFRDWAAEKMPTVPAMVAEMALAHTVGNTTEKAYLRSDLRDLRFQLMDAWGWFCVPSSRPADAS